MAGSAAASAAGAAPDRLTADTPSRPAATLVALILVAAVANLNLSVANVALPAIGSAFDSSQTTLDLIAVGYSLGLACSVLWLGAVGDRYGRKLLLVLGTVLASPPACSPRTRHPTRSSGWPGSSAGWPPVWPTRPPWP